MQTFTGFEYLLIDAANNFGNDKLPFDERIAWTTENLEELEALGDATPDWKDKPLYVKAVQAIRKAQRGEPTGHMVGFDATNSGLQVMSVMTGCAVGAEASGLVDPDRRADAYTDCSALMSQFLGYQLQNQRLAVKEAMIPAFYGSVKAPEEEFGKDTPEVAAFWKAFEALGPGAYKLLQVLVASWKPFAKVHEWTLPDGYHAYCRVWEKHKKRIPVDELDKGRFTYIYYTNEGEETGVKNAANVVHSVDAYILRSLIRRCSYDHQEVDYTQRCVATALLELTTDHFMQYQYAEIMEMIGEPSPELQFYKEQYERSTIVDLAILPYLDQSSVYHLDPEHLRKLNVILNSMLEHKPFPIITVHDDFKCHANNMNWLRLHYRNILAEMADSQILSDLLEQLYGFPGKWTKSDPTLGQKIYQSNYALC